MKLPAERVLNRTLTDDLGVPVIRFEVLPIATGETLRIAFASQTGDWRQGVWLAVNGMLDIAGRIESQFTIWTDTAPREFDVHVVETTDGMLRLYNVWDSKRGIRRESQSHTSGMLKEEDGARITYRCNDIGFHPRFDKLVFELQRAN